MAGVSVVFKLIDEISDKFDSLYSKGTKLLDVFDRIGSLGDSAITEVTTSAEEAAQALDDAAIATDGWADKMDGYNDEAAEAISATEELVEANSKVQDALGDTSTAAERTGEEIEKLGRKSEESGKKSEESSKRSTDAISALDSLLTAVGIAKAVDEITQAFVECSQAAAQYEASIAKLSTIADTAVLSTGELASQVSGLSREVAQGVDGLADSAYNAISAGVDTAEAVNAVENATKLAVSGFTNVSSSLSVLTTATNAYGLEASEMMNISDSLIMTQNKGVLTIDQLSSSMGKAISTASAYNIDLYNLEAGYISLTKAGISVEESTTYISSMFNELGDAGSEVAAVIKDVTGQSFGELMEAGYSLADVLSIVYDSVEHNNEALMNLWGSAEAGKASNAIISQGLEEFNENLQIVANSAGTTEKAYAAMTDTTEFASQRLENSFDNLAITIGTEVNPAVASVKNTFADVVDGITGFLEKHPAAVTALVSIGAAITTVGTALMALVAVTKLVPAVITAVQVAITKLGISMTAAMGVIGALATAVAVITAVYISCADAEDELSAGTIKQKEELEDLTTQYDKMVDSGKASAQELADMKANLDEATEAYENSKQTLEEFYQELDSVCGAYEELSQAYSDTKREIQDNYDRTLYLADSLRELSESADSSYSSQKNAESIVSKLNKMYPELALSVGDTAEGFGELATQIEAAANASKQKSDYELAMETYEELQMQLEQLLEKQKEVQMQYKQACEDYADESWAVGVWAEVWRTGVVGALDDAEDALNRVNKDVDDCNDKIAECEATIKEYDEALTQGAQTLEDGVGWAAEYWERHLQGSSDAAVGVNDLATAYLEAYDTAFTSIQSQIGLFDTMKTECEMSVQDMQKAMQSQLEYLTQYEENLKKAEEYGFNGDLISQLSDGSEESAGQLAQIIKEYEAAGGAASDAANQMRDSLNSTYSAVQEEKVKWADTVAEMETNFSEKLNEMKDEMDTFIAELDMSEEAKTAANSTMDSYISALKPKIREIQRLYGGIDLTKEEYSNTLSSTVLSGEYAAGTQNAAPGIALVGEEGPELVRFGGGEVVYTAEQTAGILSGRTSDREFYASPGSMDAYSTNGQDKTITLKIDGGDGIRVKGNGSVGKEEVLKVLMENAKGVFMGILQNEILEEGDLSYEF